MNWTIIHNPTASSGKSAKRWPEIKALLEQLGIGYEYHATQGPGHATHLAAQAIQGGARRLVAIGGDGTANEVANGIFQQTEVPTTDILLAQIPVGTGNDWGRTIGIPRKWPEAVRALQSDKSILQDVGIVDHASTGKPQRHYFVNIGGMGFDAFVGITANEKKAQGKGGVMGYVSALISSLLKWKARPLSYNVDGEAIADEKVFSLVIGICKYNGGGMKQCPDAIYDDGLLDLTIIQDLPKMKVIRNVPRLFSGTFVKNREVKQYRGREIRLECEPGNPLEVDGEVIGEGPATFSLIPKALRVVVG